jgi:hypothetical protein
MKKNTINNLRFASQFVKKTSLFLLLILFIGVQNSVAQSDDLEIQKGLSDSELKELVQKQTFRYFWEGADPNSGLARERYWIDEEYPHEDRVVVTAGGSGFGLMAIIVGIEREFITREEGLDRFEQIIGFLEESDRFNGVWPHWWIGETGETRPFSPQDDGADIVETSLLAQGLITVMEYLRDGTNLEQAIAERIEKLWREINWNWHTRNSEENVLYWHWSPNHEWAMDHEIRGYNESLITYVLAAASPTYPISEDVYHEGWARGSEMSTSTTHEGLTLTMRHNRGGIYGGPLFWAHYSYLGLDPRNLEDRYTHYWEHNVNHTLLNRQYVLENPNGFEGYSEYSWGLTSSYSTRGYAAHSAENDLGVITPTAALSSFPYTPEYSMKAMRYFYEELGDRLWGKYGFYDAFSKEEDWFPKRYLAIDQGPIIVMIENHRTGLLWDLFMKNEDVQNGLDRLGFSY